MTTRLAFGRGSGPSSRDCYFTTRRWDESADPEEHRVESSVYRRRETKSKEAFWIEGNFTDLHVEGDTAWLATQDGRICSIDAGGTWTDHQGVSGSHVWAAGPNQVFAWTVAQKAIHVFDGSTWKSVDIPQAPLCVHGAGDVVVASGWGGFMGRWDGSTFVRMPADTTSTFHQVQVVGSDEMLAICDRRTVWSSDGTRWTPTPTATASQALNFVAKWDGRIWIAHDKRGLCTVEPDGSLTVVKDKFQGITHIDARGELFITSADRCMSSADGLKFHGLKTKLLEDLHGQRKPYWENKKS